MFFCFCCYSRSIFAPRNCLFKSLLYIFYKFDINCFDKFDKFDEFDKFASYSTGSAFGSTAINVLDTYDITQHFDHTSAFSLL